jgi:hypothetical protein
MRDDAGKKPVAFLHRTDSVESQFFDEAVLKRLIDLLDSPFGLRTVGEDELDTELIHGSAELCFSVAVFHAGSKGAGGIDPEDSVSVHIERQGFAVC